MSTHKDEIQTILVYGAGVLGSLFAGKLHQAGYQVTLLARGQRLQELRENGLVLIEHGSTKTEHIPIAVTNQLGPEDTYDLVIVVMRKTQISTILPALAANQHTPNVLFLVNNAAGPEALIEALGKERVLLGFPGAGGQRENGIVHYIISPANKQPTTIGELDGKHTRRISQIIQAFQDASLPAAVSDNMDAWLKTHVALVSPVANALYMAGGSNYRLSRTRDGLVLMIRAVKEGFQVLRALKIPITPAKYRLLALLPEPILVAMFQESFNTPQAELALARHANSARDEMQQLAEEFRELVRLSGVDTPSIDSLFCYLDPANQPIPEGQSHIQMDWRSAITGAAALLSAGIVAGRLLTKRKK